MTPQGPDKPCRKQHMYAECALNTRVNKEMQYKFILVLSELVIYIYMFFSFHFLFYFYFIFSTGDLRIWQDKKWPCKYGKEGNDVPKSWTASHLSMLLLWSMPLEQARVVITRKKRCDIPRGFSHHCAKTRAEFYPGVKTCAGYYPGWKSRAGFYPTLFIFGGTSLIIMIFVFH